MPDTAHSLELEDLIIALYAAIDDALAHAGIAAKNGKAIHRRGPAPDVDDREILCLSLLQEIMGFESDHSFHLWLNRDRLIALLFPRRLTRQKFAERRSLLTPILQRLSLAFASLDGDVAPPLPSSTRTQSTSAAS
jgi:hypothetical protein